MCPAIKDTLFKQQQKYRVVSYLEPDLREIQWQPPQVLWKKGVLRNFAKFTGKQQYPRLVIIVARIRQFARISPY